MGFRRMSYMYKQTKTKCRTVASTWNYPLEKKIGVNLCVCNNKNNLVICDYYSNYPEVCPLKKTTSTAVIKTLKFVFAGHGIPKIIILDIRPQFSSDELMKFWEIYNFQHKTSSPKHPKSNESAEKTFGIMRNLIKKSRDEFFHGLLAYRATPLICGKSPAANFGQTYLFWKSNFIHLTVKKSQDTEKQVRRNRKNYYDRTAHQLPNLQGDVVRLWSSADTAWTKEQFGPKIVHCLNGKREIPKNPKRHSENQWRSDKLYKQWNRTVWSWQCRNRTRYCEKMYKRAS